MSLYDSETTKIFSPTKTPEFLAAGVQIIWAPMWWVLMGKPSPRDRHDVAGNRVKGRTEPGALTGGLALQDRLPSCRRFLKQDVSLHAQDYAGCDRRCGF